MELQPIIRSRPQAKKEECPHIGRVGLKIRVTYRMINQIGKHIRIMRAKFLTLREGSY